MQASARMHFCKGGDWCLFRIHLVGQVISKSWSFFTRTEFTPLKLASKSIFFFFLFLFFDYFYFFCGGGRGRRGKGVEAVLFKHFRNYLKDAPN